MDSKSNTIFTVITSTYNQAKFIAQAIESVITQEGNFYIDYIIQDAKSPDNTVEVIKEYESKIKEHSTEQELFGLTFNVPKDNSLIRCKGISYRWVSEKDNGTVDGINRGIAKAIGNIFVFLHSDDVFDAFAFANVMHGYEKYPDATVIYGNAFEIDEKGKVRSAFPINKPEKYLNTSGCLSQPSTFVKMDVIKKFGGLNVKLHNSFDYDLWAKLYTSGYKLQYIEPVLSRTRIHEQTKTKLNRMPIFLESLAVAEHYFGKVSPVWKQNIAMEKSFFSRGTYVLQTILSYIRIYYLRAFARIWYKIKGFQPKVDAKIKELYGDE